MAPSKVTTLLPAANINRKGILTRSQNQNLIANNLICKGKRKADASPGKEQIAKRSAFGDITNDVNNVQIHENKKGVTKKLQNKIITTLKATTVKQNVANLENIPLQPTVRLNKILTRASIKDPSVVSTTAVKPKENLKPDAAKLNIRRITNEFERTEDSLYVSAVEEM